MDTSVGERFRKRVSAKLRPVFILFAFFLYRSVLVWRSEATPLVSRQAHVMVANINLNTRLVL